VSGWNRFNQPESTDAIAAFEVDELLMSLVEKNLVVREEITGRYHLLETIRDYGRGCFETLEEPEALRNRHLDYFLHLAEEAKPRLTGPDQATWLDRLETEHDNLRAGLEWSSDKGGDSEAGLKLAGSVWQFWEMRGYLREGRGRLAVLLDVGTGDSRSAVRAMALNGAGALAHDQGDYPAARALYEESLAIRREMGDRRGIATSLSNCGIVAYEERDYPTARALYEESLAMFRELGDRRGIANSLNNLGEVEHEQCDYPSARALYEESLAIRRELGDRRGIAVSLDSLGNVAYDQGDYSASRVLLEESLAIMRDLGNPWGIALSLEGIAPAIAALGSPDRAACIWGAAGRLREENGSPLSPNERSRHDEQVSAARAAMNNDVLFDGAWNEGRNLTMEQAIALALENPS
jgi:tetratricopeptide (TPR) repeat protein